MKKLSKQQQKRVRELNERNKVLTEIVLEKIEDTTSPIPLNLVLESRFNSISKAGIALEGEIAYLYEQLAEEPNEENAEAIRKLIEINNRRLDTIRGQISELNNVGDLLKEYNRFGREFTILPL